MHVLRNLMILDMLYDLFNIFHDFLNIYCLYLALELKFLHAETYLGSEQPHVRTEVLVSVHTVILGSDKGFVINFISK